MRHISVAICTLSTIFLKFWEAELPVLREGVGVGECDIDHIG
jgi:hypothetical protein